MFIGLNIQNTEERIYRQLEYFFIIYFGARTDGFP